MRNYYNDEPSVIIAALDLENKTIQGAEIYTSVKGIKPFKLPINSISETEITFKECFKWYNASECQDGIAKCIYTIRRESLEFEKWVNRRWSQNKEYSFACNLIDYAKYQDIKQTWQKIFDADKLKAEKEKQLKDKRLWEKQGDNQI